MCLGLCVVLGSDVDGWAVVGLGSIRLAVFRSFVMRFSCRVSDFVMGGCNLVLFPVGGGWV
jgi:hypothetical protein